MWINQKTLSGMEIQSPVIKESYYMLQKSPNLPKYPTLSALNGIVIDDSNPNGDHIDGHKQPDHEKDSMSSFRTVHSNLVPVGYSTKLPGHTTTNSPYK